MELSPVELSIAHMSGIIQGRPIIEVWAITQTLIMNTLTGLALRTFQQ